MAGAQKQVIFQFGRLCCSALIFVLLFTQRAEAAQTGKIYTNGRWQDVESSERLQADQFTFLKDFFQLPGASDFAQLARQFLEQNSFTLNMQHSGLNWVPLRSDSGPELLTQRMQKTWNGLPVLGGDAVVHLSLSGDPLFANADGTSLAHLSAQGLIASQTAQAIAFASYPANAWAAKEPELKVLILGTGARKAAHLVYEVTVIDRDRFSSDIHFIDAQSGQELMATTNVHTVQAGPNRIVSAGLGDETDFSLDESLWSLIYSDKGCGEAGELGGRQRPALRDGVPSPCATVDARVRSSALSAWNNSGLVHEYFLSAHGRDSIDGKGIALKSVVNFGGSGFPNAAWYDDKSIMLYGMGDEKNLNDFASPLDVAAHEITHGLTSRTANLAYVSESGALNESYSDVFGKLVAFRFGKASDWVLGRDLFVDGKRFIRDMENPEVAHVKDFKYKDQFCGRLNDFCGVHTNSGIPNRAAVLAAKKIGLEKLGRIYYLTLTQLLRSNSDFSEARAQTETACATLYGKNSQDCAAIRAAFSSVGID